MSYEDLMMAQAERTAKDTAKEMKKAERAVKKAQRLITPRKRPKRLRTRQMKLSQARGVAGSASVLKQNMRQNQRPRWDR
jgi:hypothetical protein